MWIGTGEQDALQDQPRDQEACWLCQASQLQKGSHQGMGVVVVACYVACMFATTSWYIWSSQIWTYDSKRIHYNWTSFIPPMTNDWFPMFATPVRIRSSMTLSWRMTRPWRTIMKMCLIIMSCLIIKLIDEYGHQYIWYLIALSAVVLWSWWLSQTPKNMNT